MKKIAVILNGCGAKDGSEIHEATLTLLGLELAGAEPVCLALNSPQNRTVDHLTGGTTSEKRNMLHEAARIARGKIQDLSQAKASNFDGVVIPGGFGTAFNLCNFAEAGEAMQVNPVVKNFLVEMHRAKKPIGALCIAPIMLAKIFGEVGVQLTLGDDNGGASEKARKMGAKTVLLKSSECCVDLNHKIVTAPAYMNEVTIKDVWPGIKKLTEEVVKIA